MLYVGIDWADDHHNVCFTDETATTLAQFQTPHSADGFASLHAEIASIRPSPPRSWLRWRSHVGC
jgi:hypothetical protein